jgi:hypothetical protein
MRRSVSIENEYLRVKVLREGGHIAEILDKQTGINPLWTPPWPSIEPSAYDAAVHQYGAPAEAPLLAGIMGHNVCLDVFGGPSPEEEAAGITVHGEASITPYEIETRDSHLRMRAELPLAGLRFQRHIEFDGRTVHIRETVENLAATDRPIAWTQHVSLGPPFLEKGATQLRMSATRSMTFETAFGAADYLPPATEFLWPVAGTVDLSTLHAAPVSSAFTTHLMDPDRDEAFFTATSPRHQLALTYRWKRADFPWLGMWQENHSRTQAPWNGETLALGMEFGVSPIPESRREMIERHRLFGVPTFRWLPARSRVSADYQAELTLMK